MKDLDEQYKTLLKEHAELEAEHKRMSGKPYDKAAHAAHVRRLHKHSNRLHAYVRARFKDGSQPKE